MFFNPKANAGKTEISIKKYEKKLIKKGYQPVMVDLMATKDLKEIIAKINSSDIVIIAGGDGTINNSLNNQLFNDLSSRIFVLRSGRGNDFSRNFKKKFFELQGGFKNFPEITYNDSTQRFVNGMGMGIDAVTCSIQHDNFELGKKVSYFSVACNAFKSFKPYSLDAIVDGKSYHYDNVWFFVIQNGKYFGGGMKISPKSIVNDDKLELCVVHDMKLSKLLTVFPSIFIGKHTIFKKHIDFISGQDFKLIPNGTEILQIDGEIRKKVKTVRVKSAL